MKYDLKSTCSVLAICFAASGAVAQDAGGSTSAGASAGVSLLSPQQTGFMYGGQVGVAGVGSAAVSVAETGSNTTFIGFATSEIATTGETTTDAGTLGTFEFDRDVTVNGSLVGIGQVAAEGMATGASGFVGASNSFAEFGGVENIDEVDATGTLAASDSSLAETEAALTGSIQSVANLNLVGTENRFAAANGTTIGENTQGVSFGSLLTSSGSTGVSIAPLALTGVADATTSFTDGDSGVSFLVDSELNGPIDLSVSNAGGGSISLSGQTGGFFSGGGSAFGEFDFGQSITLDANP